MLRFFPILLAVALGFQPVGEAFFYFWYFLDTPSFENAFCENIEKPELQCHGQCRLVEVAATAAVPEQQPANGPQTSFPEPRQIDSTIPPSCMAQVSIAWLTTNDNTFPYQPLFGSDWKSSPFKPPVSGDLV
ncbi:MAG: hypothetical protein H6563_08965 [Lewinellaceae bacterium]|nr:hypothetical protein [Lewinellaceae bacterium]